MMKQVMDLFNGPNQVPAIVLAVAAFVLGMIAMCILCKLFCPCGKKKCAGKPQQQSHKADGQGEEKPVKVHQPPADGSIEIYVGNLSYEMTEDQLRKEFEAYGTVNSARIIANKYNGKSKGFGFVHMPNSDEVDAAIKGLSEKEVLGRKLRCNVAKNAS